ncbi:PP2C family protein-serine/threonine phosphatase [Streptomyces lichenis]|uniref:SpoIIE family protein phosphatase n=1 Tax=Streptomyces lichenis TaxID=2306967 RepID=A0ABT0IJX3_9ACTN|nr:SpoIIE family protein phosphatase [Streptomyces lichenis]MCK8681624.1 SpoIIE family protein phosphatase [Streptomyces lichenis]
MPSHLFADRPASPPPERAVDALISQTRRLRGGVDAVRRDAEVDEDDPRGRWQRALCDLAVHQLDDVGAQLGQLKDGLPADGVEAADGPGSALPEAEGVVEPDAAAAGTVAGGVPAGSLVGRVGSAEWDLLTDAVHWSPELFTVLGRPAGSRPLTLDELPSVVFVEDQALLTAMVTGCLVDGKAMDGEFRVVRGDGQVRTVHMAGEPVLDGEGTTASMWAVLRDVSELRRSERAVRASLDSLERTREIERTEHRLAVEFQEAVLPPWRGDGGLPDGAGGLELAGRCLPSDAPTAIGGDWYDALRLPDGEVLLTAGGLTGHGLSAASAMTMVLGALRGLAVAGIRPGALLGHLGEVLECSAQSALVGAVCCRYDPRAGVLHWAQAGHPAPLLFRGGTGWALPRPEGALLGAVSGAVYEQARVRLLPGDVLVLGTEGLLGDRGASTAGEADGTGRLLGLAGRLERAADAQECARIVVEACGTAPREGDACLLVVRVGAAAEV